MALEHGSRLPERRALVQMTQEHAIQWAKTYMPIVDLVREITWYGMDTRDSHRLSMRASFTRRTSLMRRTRRRASMILMSMPPNQLASPPMSRSEASTEMVSSANHPRK